MVESFREPLALFAEASAALLRRNWESLAALCDPWSLRAFQQLIVAEYEPTREAADITADTFRRFQPDMPAVVAEYQVAQHRKRWEERLQRIEDEVAGVTSYEELIALSPASLFARWLEAHSLGAQLRRLFQKHPELVKAPELSVSSIPESSVEAIGVAVEQDWAYVVYREKNLAAQIKQADRAKESESERPDWVDDPRWRLVRVAPMHRQPNGEWRLIADYNFLVGQHHVSDLQLERKEDSDAGAA